MKQEKFSFKITNINGCFIEGDEKSILFSFCIKDEDDGLVELEWKDLAKISYEERG